MNLASDMKMLHAKRFREGKIRQATFLKSFKKEILGLISLDYKPAEIKDYLEEKLDVQINMNSFYAWLNYTKERSIEREGSSSEQIRTMSIEPTASEQMASKPKSTLDVLSSTDFD